MCFVFGSGVSAEESVVPTLDKLHNQGVINPSTIVKDDDGNITYAGDVYPESAYTLTKIENADPENLPANTITIYEKTSDGTVSPVFYVAALKQTEYGEGDGVKYFKWNRTDEGIKLEETT